MKTLSCAAMGDSTCSFVAKGETDQEVMDMMMTHVKQHHAAVLEKVDMDQMSAKMMSKMQTA